MQLLNLLTGLCLLVASAGVTAAFSATAFEVSNLEVDRITSGNFSVSFSVHDPDPLTNATEICSGTWKFGSNGYPQGSYKMCSNNTFGWNMAEFTGYQRFTLGLQHAFKDPSIGDPPYDGVITFGDAKVNRTNLACEKSGNSVDCEQKPGVILGPITRTSAKKS